MKPRKAKLVESNPQADMGLIKTYTMYCPECDEAFTVFRMYELEDGDTEICVCGEPLEVLGS